MPIFEYDCGLHQIEEIVLGREPFETVICPECGSLAWRICSVPAVHVGKEIQNLDQAKLQKEVNKEIVKRERGMRVTGAGLRLGRPPSG